MNAPIRTLAAAALLLGALPLAAQTSRPAADSSMSAHLAMSESSGPFRATAERFAAVAASGDAARVAAMISPSMRERAGDEAVARVVTTQVLPFFAGTAGIGRSVTITNTTDQFGNAGFAFYMYAAPKGGGEARPFVLYVVEEGGKPVVANVLVDRLVEGRHR